MGAVLDRRGSSPPSAGTGSNPPSVGAWPLCAAGLVLIILPLSAIALSDNTLFGWVYRKPAYLTETEHRLLSFVCNGIVYLGLAGVTSD